MPSKKSILKGMVNGVVTELYPKTSADNVFAASGTDLETLLTTIPTTETVNGLISAAIDALIDGAPATYDTLKEISDWIATHQSEYEALIAAIAGKVDKVEGKGLSTNDFTDALLTKLNGIEAGANAYTLPAATTSALGGVKVGANLAVDSNGEISGNYSAATTSANGLMSSTDKAKLDGIEAGATAVTVDSSITAASTNPVESAAIYTALAGKVDTETGKGLSSNDYTDTEKTKLAGIEANANNYTLPAATTSALGGVSVGSNLAVDANGVLSGNYSNATTSAAGLMSAADKTALDAKPNVYVQSTQPSGLKAGDLWFEIPAES
jgi:phage gp45-like